MKPVLRRSYLLDGKPVTVTWIDPDGKVVGLTAADGHPLVLPLAVFAAAAEEVAQ